jgi:integrase
MPAQKRHKTKYAGVYYIEGKAVGSEKPERIYYIMYRKDGRQIHEKAGRHYQDDMTPARAAGIRADRIAGKELPNKERREAIEAEKKAKEARWTIERLWKEYSASRTQTKSLVTDTYRYDKFLKSTFGKKEPHQIDALSVDRLRIRLLKKKSPQTVKHVLNLLTWIINYGKKNGLCTGLSFKIKKPKVNNKVTEDLSPDQLKSLLKAIDENEHPHAGPMMELALYTGMRRGEMFKLKWKDIDFDKGFITLVDPKGGPDQKIPLNDAARELLSDHIRTDSPYVFPGRYGKQRVTIAVPAQEIKKKAGLPKDFRPLHGLRHVYASMLASSGKVDMYQLQRLLTHKSPVMTQRYAHLRDEALKRASDVASDIIGQIDKEAVK